MVISRTYGFLHTKKEAQLTQGDKSYLTQPQAAPGGIDHSRGTCWSGNSGASHHPSVMRKIQWSPLMTFCIPTRTSNDSVNVWRKPRFQVQKRKFHREPPLNKPRLSVFSSKKTELKRCFFSHLKLFTQATHTCHNRRAVVRCSTVSVPGEQRSALFTSTPHLHVCSDNAPSLLLPRPGFPGILPLISSKAE